MRAKRRHHRERIKRRRRQHFCFNHMEPTPRQIGMRIDTAKLCSCWMCGNARAIEGDTIQERREFQCAGEVE